jgi:hypothetical protein
MTIVPKSGKSKMVNGAVAKNPLIVNVNVAPVTEHHHDDGQCDRCFRRGDRNHDENENLPRHIGELAREGGEGEVACIPHQLDRHQHHDGIAAQQEADHAHHEQRGGNG